MRTLCFYSCRTDKVFAIVDSRWCQGRILREVLAHQLSHGSVALGGIRLRTIFDDVTPTVALDNVGVCDAVIDLAINEVLERTVAAEYLHVGQSPAVAIPGACELQTSNLQPRT